MVWDGSASGLPSGGGAGLPPGAGFRRAPGGGFGLACDAGARCLLREGVVDIMRGLLARRGGYNARWCGHRASVPTTRAGVRVAGRAVPRGSLSIFLCMRVRGRG